MMLAGMVKSSFVDYPGLIACVLFVPGCNYDCFYCHNRPLLNSAVETLSTADAITFLQKRIAQLDAVVVTGGEPTLQRDLIPFLREIKALGYRLKLDTNGSCPEVLKQVLEAALCDYFAVDYKAPQRRYAEICGDGAQAGPVLESISLLNRAGVDFEVRTTVNPQLSLDDLRTMAQELPQVPRYVLNRYRKPDCYKPIDETRIHQTAYSQAELIRLAEALRIIQPGITA